MPQARLGIWISSVFYLQSLSCSSCPVSRLPMTTGVLLISTFVSCPYFQSIFKSCLLFLWNISRINYFSTFPFYLPGASNRDLSPGCYNSLPAGIPESVLDCLQPGWACYNWSQGMLLCSSKPFKVFPGKTSDRYLILTSFFSYLNFTLEFFMCKLFWCRVILKNYQWFFFFLFLTSIFLM